MKHIHMDEFAKLISPLHIMDPRAKAVSFLLFIFLTVTIMNPVLLLFAVCFWIVMLLISHIPLGYVLKRLSWILPFAGVLIILFPFITPGEPLGLMDFGFFQAAPTRQGIDKAIMLFLRVAASVLALVTLTATTRFNDLVKALADLKVPVIIIQMVTFTLRYIFVTIDELKRMRRSRRARGFAAGKNIWHAHTVKTLAQMVGVMFIRAYERGDRVYVAMLARGFTGEFKALQEFTAAPGDYIKAVGISVLGIVLFALDKGGLVS